MTSYVKGPAAAETPLHKFTPNLTRAWLFGGQLQKALATKLAKDYPSGVGVVSATMYLIAYVQPNGAVRELLPPFRRYERWQMANAPEHQMCECQQWIDTETGEAWKVRNPQKHHPVCTWRRMAARVFDRHNQEALSGKARPDLLSRISREEQQD